MGLLGCIGFDRFQVHGEKGDKKAGENGSGKRPGRPPVQPEKASVESRPKESRRSSTIRGRRR